MAGIKIGEILHAGVEVSALGKIVFLRNFELLPFARGPASTPDRVVLSVAEGLCIFDLEVPVRAGEVDLQPEVVLLSSFQLNGIEAATLQVHRAFRWESSHLSFQE